MSTTEAIMSTMDKSVTKLIVAMHNSYNNFVDLDDLVNEAALAYLRAKRTYAHNTRKTTFRTYAVTVVRNALINYIKKECRTRQENVEIQDNHKICQSTERAYLRRERLQSWKEALPKDLKIIYQLLEDGGIIDRSTKRTRGNIVRKLREMGWAHNRIWKAIRDMKSEVKALATT